MRCGNDVHPGPPRRSNARSALLGPCLLVRFVCYAAFSPRAGSGKPRGIRAGRKLLTDRREQRWASKRYKKANLGTQFKCNPFGGSSHAKGIVLEKIGIEAKQPNSAIRKCVRAQLIKNGKKIAAFVPNDGCLNFVDENVRAARQLGRARRPHLADAARLQVPALTRRVCFPLCCGMQDEVLIAGFGRKGHAVGDIPGVRFKVVKVSGVSLIALYREKKEKPRS